MLLRILAIKEISSAQPVIFGFSEPMRISYGQLSRFSISSSINIAYLSPVIARWYCFHPVCLLLAKISLKFCKYVRLTVCLSVCQSVCLFVCNIHDTGRTVEAINTKLGTYMYLESGYRYIRFGVDDIIGDVIKFQNRSNFEIAITPSIF